MRQRLQHPAFRIPLLYLAVALPWVLFTDFLVRELSPSVESGDAIASLKGAAFVLVTTLILFAVIRRAFRRVEAARDRAEDSEFRFRALVSSVDDLVFMTDRDQRLTEIVLAGGSEENRTWAVGQTAVEMFGEDVGRPMMEMGARALAGETLTLDWHAEIAPPVFPVPDHVTSLHIVLGPLRDANGAIVGTIGIGRDTSRERDLERQHEQFESRISFLQNYDTLTGLPGRTLLEARLGEAIAIAERDGGHVGVFVLNLDDFKDINDSLGWEVGDEVLQVVGRRLAALVGRNYALARLSGDEFAIVRPVSPDRDAIAEFSSEVLGILDAPIAAAGQSIFISASMGIAIYPEDAENAVDVLRAADTAMFDAKESRANFAFFHTGLADDARDRLALANELRHALLAGEITVAYQPIVDAVDGRILAFEALARWNSATRGVVPPATFIPVAERAGIIDDIGRTVRVSAYQWLQEAHLAGFGDLQIEVNVSPYHFRGGSIERLVDEAESVGLHPEHIILELTESALIEVRGPMETMLTELRRHGFGLAVDDFGTGYSSLTYLARLPVSVLKIAQEFVRGSEQEGSRVVIETAIEIARRLGFQTIAEGVEEQSEADYLRSAGVECFQGYLFGHPLPPEEAMRVLRGANSPA